MMPTFIVTIVMFAVFGLICMVKAVNGNQKATYLCQNKTFMEQAQTPRMSIKQAQHFLHSEGVKRLLNEAYGNNVMNWQYSNLTGDVMCMPAVEVDFVLYNGTIGHCRFGTEDIFRAAGLFLPTGEKKEETQTPEHNAVMLWLAKNGGRLEEKIKECKANGYTSFAYPVEDDMKGFIAEIAAQYQQNTGYETTAESGNLRIQLSYELEE